MYDGGFHYIPRFLDLSDLLQERTVFLFGPRQTGKSSYIRSQVEDVAATFSLLDQRLLLSVLADPTRIRQEIEAAEIRDAIVVIDEIQKAPMLMDEVHLMMEERRIRFLQTGSSPRTLKRSGESMLGGRGSDRRMHVFTYPELSTVGYDLNRAIHAGLLPPHYLSRDPDEGLAAYVDRYLTEEVAAEGMTRNLPAFARFLETAATANAQMINYSNIARDAQVPRQTVVQWFAILYDTLLAFELPAYTRSVKRKAIETAKFFFFDPGVVRTLRRQRTIDPNGTDFGEYFAHIIFLELRAWIDYRSPRTALSYWRSRSGYEVDFLVDERIAIEVKSATTVHARHTRGIKALLEERSISRGIVVCREDRPRRVDGIDILPWERFLTELWAGRIV
ncbi:MAG: AAA family ATPase [Spirochaeta sp.]|nr:AAA family ATPase [Spirochaeta sp.]